MSKPMDDAQTDAPLDTLIALVYRHGDTDDDVLVLAVEGHHENLEPFADAAVGGDWNEVQIVHEDGPPMPPAGLGVWEMRWSWRAPRESDRGDGMPIDELCCVYIGKPTWRRVFDPAGAALASPRATGSPAKPFTWVVVDQDGDVVEDVRFWHGEGAREAAMHEAEVANDEAKYDKRAEYFHAIPLYDHPSPALASASPTLESEGLTEEDLAEAIRDEAVGLPPGYGRDPRASLASAPSSHIVTDSALAAILHQLEVGEASTGDVRDVAWCAKQLRAYIEASLASATAGEQVPEVFMEVIEHAWMGGAPQEIVDRLAAAYPAFAERLYLFLAALVDNTPASPPVPESPSPERSDS